VYNNLNTAAQRAGGLAPYSGQRVTGFNDQQLRGQQGLLNLAEQRPWSGLLDQGAQTAQRAAAYQPQQIAPRTYAPSVAQASLAQTPDRSQVRDISAGSIGADAIAAYTNPWDSQVLDTSLAEIERQKRIEQVQNDALATRSHAFGGTGAAVQRSLTNDSYARQKAQTTAALRQAGWTMGLQAAQADRGARLTADQANQAADLSMAGLLNTTHLANANALQQAGQFNAASFNEAGRFNAGQGFAADQANQQAGLSANQQSLTAAGLLGNFSDQLRNQATGDAGLIGQVGDARQAQAQRELEAALKAWQDDQTVTMNQQQLLNTALALVPATMTTTSDGKSTTVEKKPFDALAALATLAKISAGAA